MTKGPLASCPSSPTTGGLAALALAHASAVPSDLFAFSKPLPCFQPTPAWVPSAWHPKAKRQLRRRRTKNLQGAGSPLRARRGGSLGPCRKLRHQQRTALALTVRAQTQGQPKPPTPAQPDAARQAWAKPSSTSRSTRTTTASWARQFRSSSRTRCSMERSPRTLWTSLRGSTRCHMHGIICMYACVSTYCKLHLLVRKRNPNAHVPAHVHTRTRIIRNVHRNRPRPIPHKCTRKMPGLHMHTAFATVRIDMHKFNLFTCATAPPHHTPPSQLPIAPLPATPGQSLTESPQYHPPIAPLSRVTPNTPHRTPAL